MQKLVTRSSSKQLAFTLVELLVVMGILGMLMMVLTPTFVSLRDQGRQGKCKANLENLCRGMEQYVSFNNDYLPAGLRADSGETWATILVSKDYSQAPRSNKAGVISSSPSPFRCPSGANGVSRSEPRSPTDYNGSGAVEVASGLIRLSQAAAGPDAQNYNILHNWYGANAIAQDANISYPMSEDSLRYTIQRSKIARPSDTITIFDGWSIHNGNAARVQARHGQGQYTNVAFLDGQVQTLDRFGPKFPGFNDVNITPRFRFKQ